MASSTSNDPIQDSLNAVSQKLARPLYFQGLTTSQLPSKAVSSASDSPIEAATAAAYGTFAEVSPTPPEDLPTLSDPIFLSLQQMAASSMQSVATGHRDIVLAVDFNYFGTRMVSAGADHRLEVCDKKDDNWVTVDRWKAHDAEITDVSISHVTLGADTNARQVKWNGPFMGDVVASIGEDGQCKLWQEDSTEVIMSGNRFKLIANIKSMTQTPFMSVDFKFIHMETWLALITRDGFLTVWEPTDPNSLNEWTSIAEHWVCSDSKPAPGPQHEVGFKVVFHKEKLPCWKAIQVGLDRKSLSLAVAVMNDVQVFRTDKHKKFYRVATLEGAREVIRDVAWANGSMRGYDIIATASKDGAIRIYEISTPLFDKPSTGGTAVAATPTAQAGSTQHGRSGKNAPSGIGAGLAGASKSANYLPQDQDVKPGQIRQEAKLVDELTQHHGAVWRIAFSQMGDLLVSTGDDGVVRTWKKDKDGHWLEYAEIGGGSRD